MLLRDSLRYFIIQCYYIISKNFQLLEMLVPVLHNFAKSWFFGS